MRVLRLGTEHAADPFAPEYLYLVLQQKRLSLSATVGRLRPRNILLFPFILPIILVRLLDLSISNQIVQSLISERFLMEQVGRERPGGD
jgi:hypothetical protein